MLTKIELENFKCFKENTVFPLGKLTLLTGINGRGKSSLLQSLLLMRQSIEYDDYTTQLILNGNCLNLGRFEEIRNTGISIQEPITFKYHYEDQTDLNSDIKRKFNGIYNYSFVEDQNDDLVAQIREIEFKGEVTFTFEDKKKSHNFVFEINESYTILGDSGVIMYNTSQKNSFEPSEPQRETGDKIDRGMSRLIPNCTPLREFKIPINEFKDLDLEIKFSSENKSDWKHTYNTEQLFGLLDFTKIHYISADRLGPQDFYFKSTLPKFPNVGLRGELTANLLHRKKDEWVDPRLCLGEDANTLIIQTQEWLNKIFDGAKLEISGTKTNILELMFNTSLSKDRFRPANIGFGYHFILPIIVSGLIAKEGEILIVENPEAHLHPKAQSELAKFLAKVSSCGVQVLIKSHSDHILNGLRIAVLDKILSHEDLSILYFSQKIGESVVQIPVHSDGKIEEWPEGFFDQMDKDFERLFGI